MAVAAYAGGESYGEKYLQRKEETMKTYAAVLIMVLALAAVGCGNHIRTGMDYQQISQAQDK
jgi:hypothetical protein